MARGRPYGPVGCEQCRGTGYKGRLGDLRGNADLRRDASAHHARRDCSRYRRTRPRRKGIRNLRQSGLLKVKTGVTSLEEIEAVTNE